MNRIFGKKKEVAPPPSLSDATGRIDSSIARFFPRDFFSEIFFNNYVLRRRLDEKIAKLDGELRRYKEQMKKATGAAQVGA